MYCITAADTVQNGDDDAAGLISDTKLLSDKRMTLLASDQAHGGSLMPISLSGGG